MLQWAIDHLDFLFVCAQGVLLGVAWLLNREFVTKDDHEAALKSQAEEFGKTIEALEGEIKILAAAGQKTSGEVALMQQELKNVPTAEDISEIKLSISEMEGDYKAISENVKNMKDHVGSISRSVDRIETYMMDAAKAKSA